MAIELTDRIAIVTGAASGIGRATAIKLASRGAVVVCADIDADGCAQTVATIADSGWRASAVVTDVSDEEAVAELVRGTVEAHGRLDLAFNNAGVETHPTALHETDTATYKRTMAINVDGVFFGLKYQIPAMLASGGGAIVNTASVAGIKSFPGMGAYVASKHAVNGLTKAAATDYGAAGIRVNSVCPGAIRTPMVERSMEHAPEIASQIASMHALNRAGESEEVADFVAYLLSDEASFLSGGIYTVDGGMTAR